MSEGKLRSTSCYTEERPQGACIGDFVLLKQFLAEKDKPIWVPLQLLDALLRGYGQVAFANNPLSGLLIAIALGATAPEILIFSAATGFLGLLLSMLLRDQQHLIENGLTAFNPILVGAASCSLIPILYGEHDAFCYLLILIATIISVYLARSLGSDKFPCTTLPFNMVELVLLYTLTMQDSSGELLTVRAMVFRGMVVSSSQLFCVDNVATGAVIYLAVLVYSPATAAFSFAGVLIGTLAGLGLGAPYNEIVTGLWGFNCFLTGAALGGTLFVLNAQTAAATLVAIVYTVALQCVLETLLAKIGLPFLSWPFIFSMYSFLLLRQTSPNSVFPKPSRPSYPEKQRHDYLMNKRQIVQENVDDSEEDPTLA